MRILLIEDEKPLSAAICKMLEQEHFAVDAAYTGPDGLDCALSGIYDALILEVMLPGMDGFSVLKALRAEKKTVPVLMLTARGGVTDRVQGLNLGADYYLPTDRLPERHHAAKGRAARSGAFLRRYRAQSGNCGAPLRFDGPRDPARRKGIPADGAFPAQPRPAAAEGNAA